MENQCTVLSSSLDTDVCSTEVKRDVSIPFEFVYLVRHPSCVPNAALVNVPSEDVYSFACCFGGLCRFVFFSRGYRSASSRERSNLVFR